MIVGSSVVEKTHSVFLNQLKKKAELYEGNVQVKAAEEKGVKLRQWGRWIYDSLVLLAPELNEVGGEKLNDVVLDFINSGRSVILVGSENMSPGVRELAANVGVVFSSTDGKVVDHFEYEEEGDRTVIKATNYMSDNAGSILSKQTREGTLYWSGMGQNIARENDLAFSAIRGFSTSYCPTKKGAVSKKKGLNAFTGTDISLVSLVQARNNARVAVSGSFTMFSDAFMSKKGSSNKAFAEDVSSWVLGYKSVLRFKDLKHVKKGTGVSQDVYRIKDEISVSLKIEEWSAAKQKWLPFERSDVQVEFTMLDPHLRKTFKKDKEGKFVADVTAPDVYGVFKFVVDYKCLGYSYIHLEEQVPIRPFRHDEYERFITAAYPYYASILSTMAAFFVFGFALLYTK